MSVSTMSALSLGSPSGSLATLGTDHWAIEPEQGEQSRKMMNKLLICESFLIRCQLWLHLCDSYQDNSFNQEEEKNQVISST